MHGKRRDDVLSPFDRHHEITVLLARALTRWAQAAGPAEPAEIPPARTNALEVSDTTRLSVVNGPRALASREKGDA